VIKCGHVKIPTTKSGKRLFSKMVWTKKKKVSKTESQEKSEKLFIKSKLHKKALVETHF